MNDPEAAEAIALLPSDGGKWRPSVREYDTHAVLLSRLLSATQDVARAVIASAGGKPGKGEAPPAPRTAVDAALLRLRERAALELIDELGGG